MRKFLCLVVFLGLALAQAPSPYALRFEQAWRLVKERYYLADYNHTDWDAVGQTYRAQVAGVRSWEELYGLLMDMYHELRDDHSTVLSPELALRYLAGGQCSPLPFKDSDLFPPANTTQAQPPSQTQAPAPAETTAGPANPPTAEPSKKETKASSSAELGYEAPSVKFTDGVVVVRLSNLVDTLGFASLQDAIRRYDAKAKGYVLDIRGNPGGLALRMAEVAGLFMRGIPWRVVSKGLGGVPFPTLPILGQPNTQKPLVLLIDGRVNSAAEGLAGALKNSKRAYVVGTRTAGNVEALTPYCFSDGAVALVAGGVLAPLSGPTWEGRGVEPDLVEENPKAQLEAAINYLLKRKK